MIPDGRCSWPSIDCRYFGGLREQLFERLSEEANETSCGRRSRAWNPPAGFNVCDPRGVYFQQTPELCLTEAPPLPCFREPLHPPAPCACSRTPAKPSEHTPASHFRRCEAMVKLGHFTYEELAGVIDAQSWAVGSAGYEPADTVSVWRFCRPWVECTSGGHPSMEQASLQALASSFRAWQTQRTANRRTGLKQFKTNTSSSA